MPDLACHRTHRQLCILDLNPYEETKGEKWGNPPLGCCEAKVNKCVHIQLVNDIKLCKGRGIVMLQVSNICLRVSSYPSCNTLEEE